jgi:excisionase family DNA binding protein
MAVHVQTRFLTPPQVAERLGVSPGKVVGWLLAGELRSANLASRTTGRPRYRVNEADLAAFLAKRSASTAPAATPRRRRRKQNIVEFF